MVNRKQSSRIKKSFFRIESGFARLTDGLLSNQGGYRFFCSAFFWTALAPSTSGSSLNSARPAMPAIHSLSLIHI